jgi:hypothetical protein
MLAARPTQEVDVSPPGRALLAIVVVALWAACVVWVLLDARAMVRRGHRVTATLGRLHLEEPEAWAMANLLLWIVFLPLYLTARAES